MFPFSVTHPRSVTQSGRQTANSGYELIAFDAEKLNVFAAEVRYCEPHWHPAPELITVLAGRFTLVVGQQSLELAQGDMLYINAEEVHSLSAEEAGSQLLTVQFSPACLMNFIPRRSWTGVPADDLTLRQTARYASGWRGYWNS